MMYSIYCGLSGFPSLFGFSVELETWQVMVWDGFLVLQFPILHSYFLSTPGRKLLGKLVPREIRADMGTTLFAIVASIQLILVFGAWLHFGNVLWMPSSMLAWVVLSSFYGISWLLLLKAMLDAGLLVQTGCLGWWSVFWKTKPVYKKFSEHGLNRYTRNPIYVSFFLILWTAPVWTADRIVLAVVWSLYCLVGPVFKERRYLRYYREEYRNYQHKVPYWIPRFTLSSS